MNLSVRTWKLNTGFYCIKMLCMMFHCNFPWSTLVGKWKISTFSHVLNYL